MRGLFERSEMKDYGGGSGIWSEEHDTPIGRLRVLHWSLTRGKLTEISIDDDDGQSFSVWPSVKLDGHIKTTAPLQVYLESVFRLGGAEVLAEAIKAAVQEGFKDGEESARGAIRSALGFPS